MSASNSEVVVNHASDLSSSKKPIFFLSFHFLQTDRLSEVGIQNDLFQSRSNSRVADPQILERWGYADEDHLSKSFQATDFGLEC